MMVRLIAAGLLASAGLVTCSGANASGACASIGETDNTRLIEYVQKRYQVPSGVPLEVTDVGTLNSSCFRRLQFRAKDGLSPFRMELVVSPDLRFLSRDVMDSLVDPIQEEIRKRQEMRSSLLRGEPPLEGPEKAPVTMAVFSDFQCPYCARMAETIRDVLADQGDRVRVVYRYFPARNPSVGATGC
jgi:hypothetical protein